MNHSKQKAFTLIELLVVIAIISLLVSILLPSLNRAKELAKTVVCLSNTKNIGLGFVMYTNEYDGSCPTMNWGANWADCWTVTVAPFLIEEEYNGTPKDRPEIYVCPSKELEPGESYVRTSYGVNSPILTLPHWTAPSLPVNYIWNHDTGLDDIVSPSETMMLADAMIDYYQIWNPLGEPSTIFQYDYNGNGILDSYSVTRPYNNLGLRHSGAYIANAAMFDGSSKSVAEEEVTDLSGSGLKFWGHDTLKQYEGYTFTP